MSTTLRLHTLFATLLGTAAVAVGCSGAIASTNDTDGGTTTNADGSVSPDSSVKADGGGPDASLPAFDATVCLDDNELNYLFPKDATLTVGSSRGLLKFESGGKRMATRLRGRRQWPSAERR